MVFPKSNLSTSAQPWGRVVERSIGTLETLVATERVNNAARDKQAALSIERLDQSVVGLAGTVSSIKTITDNVFVAGTTEINGFNIKAGTIDADSINAGVLTGFTIKTAASGTRLELAGSTLDIYYGSIKVGVLSGTNVYGNEVSLLSPGTFVGLYVEPIRSYLRGDGGFVSTGGNRTTLNGGGGIIEIDSTSAYTNKFFTVNAGADIIGNFSAQGANVAFPNITDSTAAANTRWGTTTGGRLFYSTASSQRYKDNIVDISTISNLDPKKLLDLPVRAFKYKDTYQKNTEDSRYGIMMPGFIAEEVEEYYPLAADYEGDVVESWNERMIVPGLLALVQDLYKRIEILEGA
jgi:hypothetical protein